MEKVKFLLLISFTTSFCVFSQNVRYFASDGFTPFSNNPASTGSFNTFSVNAIYRNQLPSIAHVFKTYSLSVEADTKFDLARSVKKYNIPIGLNAFSFQNNSRRVQGVNVPLSVPIKFRNSTLAAGCAFGVINTENSTGLDVNAGILWYGEKFYLGGSMTNLTTPDIGDAEMTRYYNIQSGYKFQLGEHYIYTMLNGTSDLIEESTVRLMAYFLFNESKFFAGVGGSIREAYVLAVGLSLKKFKVTYVQDIHVSKNTGSIYTSHEFRLSYTIPKKH